jgi:hypothetical protein
VLRSEAEAAAARRLRRLRAASGEQRCAPRLRRKRCGPGGRCSRRTCKTRLKERSSASQRLAQRTEQARAAGTRPRCDTRRETHLARTAQQQRSHPAGHPAAWTTWEEEEERRRMTVGAFIRLRLRLSTRGAAY